ncbi:hypothetical protein LZ30DRAFT_791475 [Colletotrichum cereale]|nr:hypothetical protein LZ30DRAFT_791475 [Colletotrichum cereale]
MDNHCRTRPADCHTKHLSDTDRIRIRTLYFDGRLNRLQVLLSQGTHFWTTPTYGPPKNASQPPY